METEATARKVLLLLNDVDPLLNRVTKNKLEEVLGWQCIVAVSYEKAVEAFEVENPDVVITEILILDYKNRDGIHLVGELRAKESKKDKKVPIIIFSEMDKDEIFKKTMKTGATACYSKNELSLNSFIAELQKHAA